MADTNDHNREHEKYVAATQQAADTTQATNAQANHIAQQGGYVPGNVPNQQK